MSAAAAPGAVADYLERLRDALPASKAAEVVAEVTSLVDDRLEQEGVGRDDDAAVARALAALGPPESLAASLAGRSVSIDGATRKAFVRLLAVVFGGHLVLSIVLAALGGQANLVPGLVGPIPRESIAATACGVVGIFLVDVGLLGVLFALLGRERAPAFLPRLRLKMPGTRRDAAMSLVLLSLLAVLLNVSSVRDALISVGAPDGRAPILAPDALSLLPYANIVLFLFGLRHALLLVTGGERVQGLVIDGLASISAAALAVAILTRDELVRIPAASSLSATQAAVFQDSLYRVILVVAFVAALVLATRFVKRALRLRELLAA